MASATKTAIKCTDPLGDRLIAIRAKRGRLLVNPREADEILADLQVMYHEKGLGIDISESEN